MVLLGLTLYPLKDKQKPSFKFVRPLEFCMSTTELWDTGNACRVWGKHWWAFWVLCLASITGTRLPDFARLKQFVKSRRRRLHDTLPVRTRNFVPDAVGSGFASGWFRAGPHKQAPQSLGISSQAGRNIIVNFSCRIFLEVFVQKQSRRTDDDLGRADADPALSDLCAHRAIQERLMH